MDGEKGKYGDPKKLYKHNKELFKHNSQLSKQIDTLKNEKDSLALDKSKLKADLKSTEKELKKVSASLTSARSEVDRLRAKSHKQGGSTMGEGVEELQEKVRQLEAELTKRNEKLANFKKKVGSRLSLLEGGGNGLTEDCEPSELANSESASEEDSSKYQQGVEQEANAKLEKENSELRSRITNLESDLNRLLELMDNQQRGEFVLNTERRSSREIHLQSTDAYTELKLNGQDSPHSSPSTSPSVRRRNQTSVDVATLQTCLKLALDEKKVIAQQNERLGSRLGSAVSELEETRRLWQQEKEELLQLLLKARAEIDARDAREAQELENKEVPEVESDAKGTKGAQEPENKKVSEVESDNQGTREGREHENKELPKVESASKETQQQQSKSSSTETMAGNRRPSSSTASSTEQQSTATSDSSREQKSEPANTDQSKGDSKSRETRRRSGARRGVLQKQPSRENFTAALAIFQNGGAAAAPVVGTSFAKPISKSERRTSEVSDDGHSPQPLASPASTSSPSSPRKQSTESRPEPAVVVGKPPIPPSSSSGSDAHSRQSAVGEKSSSKMGVASKRMSWTIAQRRKSFEEQSEEPSKLEVQAQHTRASSSPTVNTAQGSPSHTRKEDKTKALEEAKRAEEEKAKREKEEKRRQELEAEEKRKRELEEKRRREAEERERLREEREERERLRREREERERERKRELEEKRKREKEERERKRQEELERKRQLEEKRRQEQLVQQELQRAKEIEREKEREAERDAALKKQREAEEQKKREKEEREERLRQEEERRAAEKAAQAAIDPRPHRINQRQSPFGSIAMRRAAFEQNNSPSSSPPVTLRNRSPMQRPKSMDVGALLSTTSTVSPSTSPTPQSPGLTSISIKTSKSPQTSPTLNERKEVKVVGRSTSISKPNPPPTVNRNSTGVSIVTTGTSSPTLRRSKTLSTATTSLAVSTPDLTCVGTSKEGNNGSIGGGGGGGWSPGSQRRTVLSTTPKSPLSERKMTKSVSFSPTPSRTQGVSRPSVPPVAGQPSSPEKMSFKAVPARLAVPAVDIKKAQSLQNIPEHAPVENITSPTISEVTRRGPVVQRRPRSERAKTTSLSHADAVSLLSKLNEKEKSVEKPVSNGVQPTLRSSRSTIGRPFSMYDSVTPARYVCTIL